MFLPRRDTFPLMRGNAITICGVKDDEVMSLEGTSRSVQPNDSKFLSPRECGDIHSASRRILEFGIDSIRLDNFSRKD